MSQRKRNTLSLSLFPFLAVLICTMGVLVALLLLVVKRAEETASQEELTAVAQAEAESSQLELQQAETTLRSQLLEQQRNERQLELARQRELLGHLENEMADVRSEAAEVAERIRSLQATIEASTDSRSLRDSVNQQQTELESLRAELEAARRDYAGITASNRRAVAPVYSIVPLASQSGTNRRPIYVECVADGMYLYPGRIKLTLDDFVLPLTPGNPLDTALLAYREYWRRTKSADANHENAYPLLVVRPSGAKWYSVARRAMTGWDQEFGYELIPEDWKVNFGSADASLVQHVQQAIESARVRQSAMVSYGQAIPATQANAVQPASSVSSSRTALIPANGGGFASAPSSANRTASASAKTGDKDGYGADPIASFSNQFQSGRISALPNSAEPSSEREASSLFASSRQTPVMPNFNSTTASGRLARSETSGRPGTGSADSENRQPSGDRAGGVPPNSLASPRSSPTSQVAASSGAAGLPSMTLPQVGQPPIADPSPVEQSSNPSPNVATDWNRDALAHERGENWALPSRRNAVSAYYRPVVVNVGSDALVLPAGEGSPKPQTIPLGPSLAEAVDPLANAIWQRVDKWGYLGFDGYWKPVLELRFTPENASKAVLLQRMLEGSGLDVKLPATDDQSAPTSPPNQREEGP
ncbi:MAG: hypothetical protein JNL67_12420 [Planctomycetaceae bacterium]|nr:hypothetical protein [Planctomycetaceae bacterium]